MAATRKGKKSHHTAVNITRLRREMGDSETGDPHVRN